METDKDITLELIEAIPCLAQRAEINIDLQDVGITLTVAMSENERADLLAMLIWMDNNSCEPGYILSQAMHDLNGLKQTYFSDIDMCFLPRSSGYSKRLQQQLLERTKS